MPLLRRFYGQTLESLVRSLACLLARSRSKKHRRKPHTHEKSHVNLCERAQNHTLSPSQNIRFWWQKKQNQQNDTKLCILNKSNRINRHSTVNESNFRSFEMRIKIIQFLSIRRNQEWTQLKLISNWQGRKNLFKWFIACECLSMNKYGIFVWFICLLIWTFVNQWKS